MLAYGFDKLCLFLFFCVCVCGHNTELYQAVAMALHFIVTFLWYFTFSGFCSHCQTIIVLSCGLIYLMYKYIWTT